MKEYCVLIILFFNFKAFSKTLVISDIDDTIRETNVLNKTQAFKHMLQGFRPFDNSALIYQGLVTNFDVDIVYISSSFDFLTPAGPWLSKNEFPVTYIFQRDIEQLFTDGKMFKIKALTDFLQKNHTYYTDYIFVGDTGESDQEVYEYISELFALKNKTILLRDIKAKHVLSSVTKSSDIYYFIKSTELSQNKKFHQAINFISNRLKKERVPNYIKDNLQKKLIKTNCSHLKMYLFRHINKIKYSKITPEFASCLRNVKKINRNFWKSYESQLSL